MRPRIATLARAPLAAAAALALAAAGCGPDGAGGGGEAGGDAAAGAAGGGAASARTAGAALSVDTMEGAGPYLTDGAGRAVYLFTADSAGTSTCHDACARVWPPLTSSGGAPSAAAPAVKSALLDTLVRRDGSVQVVYGGWPLYYFQKDTGPGTTAGQDVHGFGGEWYLVTPAGGELHAGEEEEEEESGDGG